MEELDKSGDYPSFALFADFVKTEARILCNPIAAPLLMNTAAEVRVSTRAKTFNTRAKINNPNSGKLETSNSKPRPPCVVCNDESHGVARCPTFAAKTAEEKRAIIHENHLCFGCLRKGHITKDCKRRHTCNTCGRRHPACLHIEKGQSPEETSSSDSEATANHPDTVIHKVMVHALTHHASAMSSIVPVFVSSVTASEGNSHLCPT